MTSFETRKARTKAMIAGQEIDYLPSQLDFIPYRLQCLLEEQKMSMDEFNDFACNHIYHVFPLTEAAYFSSGSEADGRLIRMAVEKGLIEPSTDPKLVNDNFRVPWIKNTVGVRYADNPIKDRDLDGFDWPDPNVPGIFDHVTGDLTGYSDEFYVLGLQHLTIHERSYLLIGYENFLESMIADPDFVEELMDRILEFHIGLARRFIELGVDGVRTGDDFGTQLDLQMSPALWRKLYKPRLARIWSLYRDAGVTVVHHSCGNIEKIVPDLIEIGLEVLHPVQPKAMSIETLSEKYGDKIVFHGGIDTQELLPFGTPREVKQATKHCVETLGSHRRYIIAPSQEIMNDVPTSNIMAIIEAIKQYR